MTKTIVTCGQSRREKNVKRDRLRMIHRASFLFVFALDLLITFGKVGATTATFLECLSIAVSLVCLLSFAAYHLDEDQLL